MAGRGCTVCITILGGTDSAGSGSSKNEELSLPVALHSPLSVLKEQLEELTGIPIADQVVILCDLTDVERNNDKLLEGRDYMSLRDCGIKNGAVMTLHALGLSAERYAAERKSKMTKAVKEIDEEASIKDEDKKRTLETKITAARADHSYNGVLFDIKCNGPFEVDLLSVSVGGMLGRVRIFARDRPCEADRPEQGSSPHWWAHRESVSNIGWTVVADVMCRPSWDKPLEIVFNQPVTLMPHSQRGLYCHSSLPDDLGIQYQSYQSKESIVAANEHITLLAGLGHTGFEPFDEQHGWYRAWRGLSGSVAYKTKWKGWSPLQHKLFPKDLKRAVSVMLLCQNRFVHDCDLEHEDEADDRPKGKSPCLDVHGKSATSYEEYSNSNEDAEQVADQREETCRDLSALRLHLLPKYLIYNILEYMHWDWFKNLESKRAAVERAKIYAARAFPNGRVVPPRSNCLPGPISVPLSMLGEMSATGQEHQMMLMIAQAISAGQGEISIGGMTLQLNQGEDESVDDTGSHHTSNLMLSRQNADYDDEDDSEYFEHDDGDDDDDDDEVGAVKGSHASRYIASSTGDSSDGEVDSGFDSEESDGEYVPAAAIASACADTNADTQAAMLVDEDYSIENSDNEESGGVHARDDDGSC